MCEAFVGVDGIELPTLPVVIGMLYSNWCLKNMLANAKKKLMHTEVVTQENGLGK